MAVERESILIVPRLHCAKVAYLNMICNWHCAQVAYLHMICHCAEVVYLHTVICNLIPTHTSETCTHMHVHWKTFSLPKVDGAMSVPVKRQRGVEETQKTLRQICLTVPLTVRGRIVHSVLVRNRGCNKSATITTLSNKMIGNHELVQSMYHES